MAAAGRRGEEGINSSSARARTRRKVSKERPALQGRGNRRLVVSQFPKYTRFFSLQEMLFVRRRKIKKEQQQEVDLVNKEGGYDIENHLELTCPYNYLSPASYAPCKARLALWGNYTTTLRYKCSRHKEEEQSEPPVHDETNSRRLGFMRCFVRVNNLPEQCHAVQPVWAAADVACSDAQVWGLQRVWWHRLPEP
ncbi:hypothetical protein EJB05_42362 [Eragrostis curvula]|uniref:Uncharacterized protein n=1 Tax=Eragrostis curvula TaxID=38414 RepID=A0A5J9TC83_9POAL|nr:hypothetical protein EJB05_42362 [Eragrostis curvula]